MPIQIDAPRVKTELELKKILLFLLTTLAFLLSSCSINPYPGAIQGSGKVVSESRPVSGFTHIIINGGGEATITQGSSESLSIAAEDNILPLITSQVVDGTLTLELKTQGSSTSLTINRPIKYTITVTDLSAFDRNGSGNTTIGDIQTASLALTAQGAGSITLASLQANQLSVENEGTGDISINAGKIGSLSLSLYGAGAFSAANLESQNAQVWLTGSGSAKLWVDQTLQVTDTGSGNVSYFGSPVITMNITGSGTLDSLGTK